MTERQTPFDPYADTYRDEIEQAIAFSRKDLDHYTEVKAAHLLDLMRRHAGDPTTLTALDVGCGTGETDRFLAPALGGLSGLDISGPSIERAQEANPGVDYRQYGGGALPFDADRFDVGFSINVLHHVELVERAAFVSELARVVRPGGLVAIAEHNPANPLTRRVVRSGAFDIGVTLVPRSKLERLLVDAGLKLVEHHYMIFLPTHSLRLDRLLRRVPLGAQYFVAARVCG